MLKMPTVSYINTTRTQSPRLCASCMCVHVCACACMWRLEDDRSCLPCQSAPYILIQGLYLNLKINDYCRLAQRHLSGILMPPHSSSGFTGTHHFAYLFTWVLMLEWQALYWQPSPACEGNFGFFCTKCPPPQSENPGNSRGKPIFDILFTL